MKNTRFSNFLILNRIFLAEKSVNNEIQGFPTGTFMNNTRIPNLKRIFLAVNCPFECFPGFQPGLL
jgi:hypothetical protein